MTQTFFASDHHFGHTNSWLTFKKKNGEPLRPFSSNEEMDETMVSKWNKLVGQNDRVYCLGDFVINRKTVDIGSRLNGKKTLVMGNHDIFKNNDYLERAGFHDLVSYRVYSDIKMICSHIPIHESCMGYGYQKNLHGHLHANVINDPRYQNVSVEQTDFSLLTYDHVKERFQENYDLFEEHGSVWNWALDALDSKYSNQETPIL
jgi:calcineurin-like phosphoesterase family protein